MKNTAYKMLCLKINKKVKLKSSEFKVVRDMAIFCLKRFVSTKKKNVGRFDRFNCKFTQVTKDASVITQINLICLYPFLIENE